MMVQTILMAMILMLVAPNPRALAQGSSAAQNLQTCMTGRTPSLCNHNLLTPEQRARVDEAERRANFETCSTGRSPALCRHNLLTAEQRRVVDEAERRTNFETCSTGRSPALCRHHLLTAEQRRVVDEAERRATFETCSTGRSPALCRRALLTDEQRRVVDEAERRVAAETRSRPPLAPGAGPPAGVPGVVLAPRGRSRPSGCENGLWINEVAGNGAILILSDGSIWRVDPVDQVISSIWLPVSDVMICGDEIINVDDREKVLARRIR